MIIDEHGTGIKSITSFGDDCQKLAKIALSNRLYVSGWELSYYLQHIIQSSTTQHTQSGITLIFKDDKPVSVCLLAHGGEINTFTRKAMRKNGLGKLAVNQMMKYKPPVYNAYGHGNGVVGASSFYKKCNVPMR